MLNFLELKMKKFTTKNFELSADLDIHCSGTGNVSSFNRVPS